jgi:ADP-heptose:LPS heptosyltransferase
MNLDKIIRDLNHRRIDYFRSIKLKLAFIFCIFVSRLFKLQSSPKVGSKIKTYLILRLDDKLGDSVTSTGFLRSLKLSSPESHVFVVAGPSTISIYESLSFVDKVILSKKGFINSIKTFLEIKKIKSINFIVNTSHILNPRSVLFIYLTPAENKIGFINAEFSIFTKTVSVDFLNDHITQRYRKLMQAMNINNYSDFDLSYSVHINDTVLSRIQKKIATINLSNKPVLAINCFAGGRLRNLNELTVKSILLKTSGLFGSVIFLANHGDHKILHSWKISEFPDCHHWPEHSSLQDNLAIAQGADLILTPDTSWVHLACALKKKLVAIYREDQNPTEANSVIWAPYGTQYERVFAKFEKGQVEDINHVNVEEIVSAIKRLL